MGLGEIIPLLLVVVFFLVTGGLKKLKQRMEQRAEAEQQPRADYEASPEEIREFMRRLGAALPQEGQAAAEVPAEGPAGTRIAVEVREPAGVPQPAREPVGVRRPPRGTRQRRRAAGTAPRARRREAVAEGPKAQAVAPGPEVAVQGPAAAPKAAAGRAPILRGMSLKQAVIWSEVLGRPLCLRQRRRPFDVLRP